MDPALSHFRRLVMNKPLPPPQPAAILEADIHRPICIRYKAHIFGNDGSCIYCRQHRDPR